MAQNFDIDYNNIN